MNVSWLSSSVQPLGRPQAESSYMSSCSEGILVHINKTLCGRIKFRTGMVVPSVTGP